MDKVRCIKECVMQERGAVVTTVGRVYDTIKDYHLEDNFFCIIDDIGFLHHFTKIGDGYLTGESEYFEEVEDGEI